MQRPARKILINFIFIVALTAMIACNIFSYLQTKQQWDANRWVIHSYKVLQKVNDILYEVIDATRLEQSYLDTGSQSFILGSEAAIKKSQNDVPELLDLVSDSPSQTSRAKEIRSLETQVSKVFDDVKQAYETKGKDNPDLTLLSTKMHQSIHDLRVITSAMTAEEQLLLDKRNEHAVGKSYESSTLIILTALLSDIFLIFSFFLLGHQEHLFIIEQMRINHELERKNKLAHEATRLKSEFLANMSHELRTPLNAVIGFSELMQDGVAGPVSTEQHEFLNDILSSAKHLLRLINDVLDLSKVEAGHMLFHPEVVNLRTLVNEVSSILHPLIDKKKINYSAVVDSDLSIAYLDPARLKQVIYNYLSNALKFTPELGTVKIHVKPESLVSLRIEVEDNGIGIKPEDMKRLFVEFQQLDSSVTKKYAGTGLGLALTKRIVEAQGGEVGLTSIPGKGSIFFAILPLTQKTDLGGDFTLSETSKSESARKRIQNVLVIEDNKNDLEWTASILTLNGFAVETAQTGETALEYCESRIFDLITLDLMLPDMNGYEILRRIRLGINVDTPVIVITASSERNKSMGFLVRDYLIKPLDKEKLLSVLAHAGSPPYRDQKILVIDNDPKALKLVTTLLENQGYNLTCVDNAKDGLIYAEKQLPDILVLDLMMPETSGFDFIRALRDRGYIKDIPIIIWTAKDLTAEEHDFLRESVQGIVLKRVADSTEMLIVEIKKITSRNPKF